MNVETQLVMPGGWHYEFVHTNNQTVRVDAPTYFDLLTRVQTFRIENGLPVGDVKRDVDTYICSNFPNQCHQFASFSPPQAAPVPSANSVRFIDKITMWLTGMRSSQQETLFKNDAEIRAKACLNCPLNKDWRHDCAACVENANRLGSFLRGGKDVQHHSKLGGCTLFNHDNRTAVWLNESNFQKRSDAPLGCWLKSI